VVYVCVYVDSGGERTARWGWWVGEWREQKRRRRRPTNGKGADDALEMSLVRTGTPPI